MMQRGRGRNNSLREGVLLEGGERRGRRGRRVRGWRGRRGRERRRVRGWRGRRGRERRREGKERERKEEGGKERERKAEGGEGGEVEEDLLPVSLNCAFDVNFLTSQGASFGAVKVAVDPTHTTDCLLVLKLFEAGTLEQQPEGPLLSAEAQTGFEFLLNSWLATLAIVGEEGKEEGPLVSALPVRVTGLLQTVINGSRCLVVGVASSAARSHPNRDVDTAGTQALQDVLDRVTVKEALTPVLVFASKYMQLAILEEPWCSPCRRCSPSRKTRALSVPTSASTGTACTLPPAISLRRLSVLRPLSRRPSVSFLCHPPFLESWC